MGINADCRQSRQLQRKAAEAEKLPTLVLVNGRGVEVHVSPVGAAIQKLLLPDRKGDHGDVVLGFDSNGPYAVRQPHRACFLHPQFVFL